MNTLTIDIGGTGTKMLAVDANAQPLGERHRELTPKPATPETVMAVIEKMLEGQPEFDRVSVGFPGVVMHGIVKTAPNLGTEAWAGFELGAAIAACTDKPTQVINDAELQGFGVIDGVGVEMVLTLGTGLGTALYVNGHLVPNLELGHHRFTKKWTYEELVCEAELERVGKKKWRESVNQIIEYLARIFNYDVLHIGGGNAKKLKGPLPDNVRMFTNVAGMTGGVRLWRDATRDAL